MLITREHFKRIYEENKITCTCLVLIINDSCNANCPVCLARQVFKSSLCKELCEGYSAKCLRCCSRSASDDTFFEALNEILDTVNSPHVDIIITGGEPTLSPRFLPTLELIAQKQYGDKTLQLETNGARLHDPEIIAALKANNVRIHLSRYGKTDEENQAEFHFTEYPTTNADIEVMAKEYGDIFGVSTVLLNHHIASAQELLDMIDAMKDLGVCKHDFLEVMMDVSLKNANKEIFEYYQQHLVPIGEITEQLEALGVKKVSVQGTEAYKYIVFEYKGTEFSLTSSDLNLQHKQETNNGFSRFLIMPSGEIGINGVEKR